MDAPTLRILTTISSSIGEPLSINQLTQQIKDTYGTAYYANTYQKLQELKKENVLHIETIGKSSNIKLNFQNYLLIDVLAEMEIEKKLTFLKKRTDLLPLIADIDALTDTYAIKSINAIDPAKNIKLNKLDLLFLLKEAPKNHTYARELYKHLIALQNKHNLKINSLILGESDFQNQIASDEINPAREALSQKIILSNPQAFWNTIKAVAEKTELKAIKAQTKPAAITEADLAYNLNRFGYKEFGLTITQGKKFSIEYIITSLLLQEDARQIEAVPTILAKNQYSANTLAFLSQKFSTAEKLLGLLISLQEIKPTPQTQDTIDLLKAFNAEPLPADTKSIQQKMRLYNAL